MGKYVRSSIEPHAAALALVEVADAFKQIERCLLVADRFLTRSMADRLCRGLERRRFQVYCAIDELVWDTGIDKELGIADFYSSYSETGRPQIEALRDWATK